MPVTILAIESSCDETSVAICRDGRILSNFIANQKVHERYGGVVPELAGRAHMQNIIPVTEVALREAAEKLGIAEGQALPMEEIDAIAFTRSPGLIGSLLVGAQFAKSLALALDKPLIAVHHMQAHVLANLIDEPRPSFPFLCLTVSGGHTQIVLCKAPLDMQILGSTIDDAAGEAFDKSAKLLGLPYPGGPLIDQYAQAGDPDRFRFPEPQVPGLDFSFSGLKTAILYFLQNAGRSQVYKEEWIATHEEQQQFIQDNLNDLCASIQERIISILLNKLKKASKQTGIKDICIAGGVSANSGLRKALREWGEKNGWKTYIPAFMYCTDNAGMIAITGYYKFLEGKIDELNIPVTARTDLDFS
jgi:N6-L-threonylcarbamoyladenine synthase